MAAFTEIGFNFYAYSLINLRDSFLLISADTSIKYVPEVRFETSICLVMI